jgi:tetratricopeptide (TPR) repeat protein
LTGDLDAAEHNYQRALERFDVTGDVLGGANCLSRLGDVAIRKGDRTSAKAYFERALTQSSEFEGWLGAPWCLNQLGYLALAENQVAEGFSYFLKSLRLSEQIPFALGKSMSLEFLAEMTKFAGSYAQAILLAEQSLILNRKAQDVLGQDRVLRLQQEVFTSLQHWGGIRRNRFCPPAARLRACRIPRADYEGRGSGLAKFPTATRSRRIPPPSRRGHTAKLRGGGWRLVCLSRPSTRNAQLRCGHNAGERNSWLTGPEVVLSFFSWRSLMSPAPTRCAWPRTPASRRWCFPRI